MVPRAMRCRLQPDPGSPILRAMDETIDWLGHATVRIELDGIRILTDPTIRERIGPLDRKVAPIPHREVEAIDVVLISHLHLDHLDLPSLRRLGDVRLIVPAGSGSLFRAAGHRDVDEFVAGRSNDPWLAVDRDRPGRSQRLPTAVRTRPDRRSGSSSRTAVGGSTSPATRRSTPRWRTSPISTSRWSRSGAGVPTCAAATWIHGWRPTRSRSSGRASRSRSIGGRSGRRRSGSSDRIDYGCPAWSSRRPRPDRAEGPHPGARTRRTPEPAR